MEYKVEIWIYYRVADTKEFSNEKDMLKWLKSKGYITMSEFGGCFIQIYQNGQELSILDMVKRFNI